MVFIVEGIDQKVGKVKTVTKDEQKWVEIGVEFRKAKEKGITSKKFAEEKGIVYSTFTKSMSRYQSQITLAYQADKIKNKKGTLNREERALLMINSFRSSIRKKVRNEGAASNTKSEKWFRETIAKSVRGHKVQKPSPGKLYAYVYDAKHKDTLPYWDQYPLIIFLGTSVSRKSGTTLMHGLNLHYIPPRARQEFLESLLKQYASTPVLSNNTRLKIDWSKVKGFKGADKMIKAYLPAHIKGTIIEIKPNDWANVIMMPLQRFKSGKENHSAKKVWG